MTEKTTLSTYLKGICTTLYNGQTPKRGGRYIFPNKHFTVDNYAGYAKYLRGLGFRDRTIKTYLFHLHRFNADITEQNLKEFESHIEYIIENKAPTNSMVIRRNYFVRFALAHYLKYIKKSDWIKHMTAYRNPQADTHDKAFPIKQLNILLSATTDEQLKLFMESAYFSGMRNQELLLITKKHLNNVNFCIKIPKTISKSHKEGIVWMPKVVFKKIVAHATSKEGNEPYIYEFLERKAVFKNLKFLENEEKLVCNMIKAASKESGVILTNDKGQFVSPHAFRHCYAKYIEDKYFPMRVRKELMRVSSSELVDRYSKSSEKEVEQAWKEKEAGE